MNDRSMGVEQIRDGDSWDLTHHSARPRAESGGFLTAIAVAGKASTSQSEALGWQQPAFLKGLGPTLGH